MLGGDVDTLVSVVDVGASGVLSTSIFFGTLEANIGQLNQKEMIPSRTCTVGFSIDSLPSQKIDSIHDKGKTVDGIHGDVVAQPTHPIMHCEPSSEDGNIGWNTLDHLGIPLTQSREFHLNCILRCAHQFDFSPHIQDLMMTLMTQRGLGDLQCLETWGLRVAQREAIGSGFPIIWLRNIHYHSFGNELIQQTVQVMVLQALFGDDWDIAQVFTWDPGGGEWYLLLRLLGDKQFQEGRTIMSPFRR